MVLPRVVADASLSISERSERPRESSRGSTPSGTRPRGLGPDSQRPEGTLSSPVVGRTQASNRSGDAESRVYFSSYWALAALSSSSQAKRLEKSLKPPKFDLGHRAHVIASVQAWVAFMEAVINELFQDAADGVGTYLAPLDEKVQRSMAAVWTGTDHGRRLEVLEKYELLVALAGAKPIERGRSPYQDVRLLVRLRNALVHYRAETISATAEAHKWEKALKNKFPDNGLMRGHRTNAWWPSFCLGHGLTVWARDSAVEFVDSTMASVGIRPYFRTVRGVQQALRRAKSQSRSQR